MDLRARLLDMDADKFVAVLNEQTAKNMGLAPDSRVEIFYKDRSVVAILNTSKRFIKPDEIGLLVDVSQELGISREDMVEVFPGEPPRSIEAVRKKIFGKKLTKEEINTIIEDIMRGALFPAEASAFIVACQINGLDMEETVHLTHAIANSGNTVKFSGEVVDKHSIGGVPGNRITFIFVPIMASLGFKVPKTSSRAITSPSGTADTMEVLANVNLTVEQIKEIVESVGGVIAWGGGAEIASADDKLIQIRRPLRLDPLGMVLASIMAKKVAVSSKYVVLDLPVGPEAKLRSFEEAKRLGNLFKEIGKRLGIKVVPFESNGIQPIGRGIGPTLEAIDILETIGGRGSKDLLEKGISITARLLSVLRKIPLARAKKIALEQIRSGRAEKKLREIIAAQEGDPHVKPEDLKPGKYFEDVVAPREGRVEYISNGIISRMARYAGAPTDKGAGIWLRVKMGTRVKKGEVLYTVYSSSKRRLRAALEVGEAVKIK